MDAEELSALTERPHPFDKHGDCGFAIGFTPAVGPSIDTHGGQGHTENTELFGERLRQRSLPKTLRGLRASRLRVRRCCFDL
jgi:hypothetical protein